MEIEAGIILHTKHSSIFGNAIVLKKLKDNKFSIMTDYGNNIILSSELVLNYYNLYLAEWVTPKYQLERWVDDWLRTREGTNIRKLL